MLLNHYTACLEKYMCGKLATMTNERGSIINFSSLDTQSAAALLPLMLHQSASIFLGSDNTPETGESYKLKNKITSGLNVALTRSVVDNDDGSHSSVVVATCTNTSSDPITIGEIGLGKYFRVYNAADDFLFDRTPLGTPLTIQPGEVGRIVYTITMS